MKTIWGLVFAVVLLVPTVRAQINDRPGPIAKRVALVIGMSDYTSMPPLKNPSHDADDLAAKLKSLGFEVTLKKNVRLKSILIRTLEEFGDRIPADGVPSFFMPGTAPRRTGTII